MFTDGNGLALIGAAIAACAGCGSGMGVGIAGQAAAGVVASIVQLVSLANDRAHMRWIATAIVGGFLTSLLPHLLQTWTGLLQTEATIAGAVMPLVPGLAMTNAVQDAVRGDMLSGMSHGMQALLTACLIAGGALMASLLVRMVTGGVLL